MENKLTFVEFKDSFSSDDNNKQSKDKDWQEIFEKQYKEASKNLNDRYIKFCEENKLDPKEEMMKMRKFMELNPYYLSQGTLGK